MLTYVPLKCLPIAQIPNQELQTQLVRSALTVLGVVELVQWCWDEYIYHADALNVLSASAPKALMGPCQLSNNTCFVQHLLAIPLQNTNCTLFFWLRYEGSFFLLLP
jgi:hypothetical protein